jgi:N-acetylglutamate synthase-like GNAT family acetyltransferase
MGADMIDHGLILLRLAILDDLPAIHGLIRSSHAAMNEYAGAASRSWERAAQLAIEEGDVSFASFANVYLSVPENGFWVAEHRDLGVIGCVGLKRLNLEDAELVRMSVSAALRGEGIGVRLVGEVLGLARRSGATRVRLKTANPAAARFYQRVGFHSVSSPRHSTHSWDVATAPRFEMSLQLRESQGPCVRPG